MPKPSQILIVDDDLGIRSTLQEILRYHGYGTQLAADGREAYDLLIKGYRPDLIFLDLMMPIMNGWEFLEKQQADSQIRLIPTVVVTAVGNSDLPPPSVRLLRKPFGLAEVLSTVREFCSDGDAKVRPAETLPGPKGVGP